MLDMRPDCECCEANLDLSGTNARTCSFDCTFCASRPEGTLMGKCPNCAGALAPRPARAGGKLARLPASRKRVVNAGGCAT
jgi:hypothetical protein